MSAVAALAGPAARRDAAAPGAPVYEGEFWTAKQRDAHPLHEVSYRACFKPQLPRYFIERLTEPGNLVYDPFAGRGTTAIETALLGRRVAANDANPLSAILTRPRLEPPLLEQVAERLARVPWQGSTRADIDLSMFYHPETETQLVALRDYLGARRAAGKEDGVDRWLRMVATNRLSGHSPGFFSVYSFPPNQAVSALAQQRINVRRGQVPPRRDVAALILRKSRQLLARLTDAERERLTGAARDAQFSCADAAAHGGLARASVQLTVTSPPFLDVVQYADDNWLRCWFNGIAIAEVAPRITMARSVERWSQVMTGVLRELYRITRPGGWVAFEVGEVRRGSVKLEEQVLPAGRSAGFAVEAVLIHRQRFTKTSHLWGVANHRAGTNTQRMVLLKKAET